MESGVQLTDFNFLENLRAHVQPACALLVGFFPNILMRVSHIVVLTPGPNNISVCLLFYKDAFAYMSTACNARDQFFHYMALERLQMSCSLLLLLIF